MVLQFPVLADYCLLWEGSQMIFATHGHKFHEKNLPPLHKGDILLHGHTHVPKCVQYERYTYCLLYTSMVLPNWISGQLPPVFAGETDIEATEYASDRAGIDRSEPFGYRSYLPGDSFKDIHWKLTQKQMCIRDRKKTTDILKS